MRASGGARQNMTNNDKVWMQKQHEKLERVLERNLERCAYHEVGHGMVALNLGIRFRRVELKVRVNPAPGAPDSLSRVLFPPYSKRTSPYRDKARGEYWITMAFGGPMAESRHRGTRVDWRRVAGNDRSMVDGLIRCYAGGCAPKTCAAYARYLKTRTAELLETLWPKIRLVVPLLMDRRVLTEDEIRELVRGVHGIR
jgi:hypothetical protein